MDKNINNTDTIHNIIKLEINKGYRNSAVFGGINEYINKWSTNIQDKIKPSLLKSRFNELILSSNYYREWDVEKRREWINSLVRWLTDYENEKTKKTKKISKYLKSASGNINFVRDLPQYNLESEITIIKGIKSSTAEKFNKLGIKTIRNLLYFFPRYHIDYSQKRMISELEVDTYDDIIMGPVTVSANIWESRNVEIGGKRIKTTEVVFGDETGNAIALWYNQPYLVKQFSTNSRVVLSGKYKIYKGKITFQSPDWDFEESETTHAGRLVPIYHLTHGLYQRQVRKLIKGAINQFAYLLIDYLPIEIRKRAGFVDLKQAIIWAHFPENDSQRVYARDRLAFDELFLLQIGLMQRKKTWQDVKPAYPIKIKPDMLKEIITKLPFELTNSQEFVLNDIISDIRQPKPMSRLLQGDVGSGKTIVAIIPLLMAVKDGYQCAFMAPTEILAEQHYTNVCKLLSDMFTKEYSDDVYCSFKFPLEEKITVALITSKTPPRIKRFIYDGLSNNTINLIIGTHSIIQKEVSFYNLNLVVIDEQHRFGVMQRNALRQKGHNPHVLVMTATPIPRTLALTLYSDLDISIINQLPPGRQQIITRWVKPDLRNRAYEFINKQVSSGYQAFIICPLVQESENIEAKAAVEEYNVLSKDVFPNLKVGLLHGKMKLNDKESIMRDFRDHNIDILVSTPVVEVGIDIPNATVILIEAADRFGLSQLHQFRGRVGRGSEKSYCLLFSDNPSEEGVQRIKSIEDINDGFKLAERDLELRGPGDFIGTRQSGLPNLVMAKLSDVHLIEKARNEALDIFRIDPDLTLPDHKYLITELNRVWFNITEWS